jgi:hypothetical protein
MDKTIETNDYIVTYQETQEIKDKIFDLVIDFYRRHGAFNGESVFQNDNVHIDCPEFMSYIVDNVIKFDYNSKE